MGSVCPLSGRASCSRSCSPFLTLPLQTARWAVGVNLHWEGEPVPSGRARWGESKEAVGEGSEGGRLSRGPRRLGLRPGSLRRLRVKWLWSHLPQLPPGGGGFGVGP